MEIEVNNTLDPYAVAAKQIRQADQEVTVGHLPREISRIVNKFMAHSGSVEGLVRDSNRRRSRIQQGGLEILINVTVTHENEKMIER